MSAARSASLRRASKLGVGQDLRHRDRQGWDAPMELDPALLAQLRASFQDELLDQVQVITGGLLDLERAGSGATDSAILNTVFRAAHNIKGSASSLGLTQLAQVAHELETELDGLRQGRSTCPPELVDRCMALLDQLPALLEAVLVMTTPPTSTTSLTDADVPEGSEPGVARAAVASTAQARDVGAALGSRSVRVGVDRFERVNAVAESLHGVKIALDDHLREHQRIAASCAMLVTEIGRIRAALAEGADEKLRARLQSNHDDGKQLFADVSSFGLALRGIQRRLVGASDELWGELKHARLEPVSSVFNSLRRPVRDLSKELGKQVELSIDGIDIQIDSVILDSMRDPLTHLIRNAIDHGIETADERQRLEKDAAGRIALAAATVGGEVLLTVRDDGAGISGESVRQAAVDGGLISESDARSMSDHAALQMIFRPGFSTRRDVTGVSGRGIGLDAAANAVASLGGQVEVSSEPGVGTTFTLRLPLTLANDTAVLVRCAGQPFALPTRHVARAMVASAQQLFHVGAARCISHADRVAPVVSLAAMLGFDSREERTELLQIILVSRGADTVGLIVDEIVGQREIVIKPLGYPVRSTRHVIGAAVDGRGRAAIVLNPQELLQDVLQGISPDAGMIYRAVPAPDVRRVKRVLLAEDSATTRMMEVGLLRAAGYEVHAAVDGEAAFEIFATTEHPFDLIVTDIEMPVLDGFGFIQRVRSSVGGGEVPIIIVSSRESADDRARGAAIGADAYLLKSAFQSEGFLNTISELL